MQVAERAMGSQGRDESTIFWFTEQVVGVAGRHQCRTAASRENAASRAREPGGSNASIAASEDVAKYAEMMKSHSNGSIDPAPYYTQIT